MPDEPGVIFRHRYRPAHFYDGCAGQRVTNENGDIDYSKPTLDNGLPTEHQLYFPSHEQINLHLSEEYRKLKNNKWYKKNPKKLPTLAWNEG